MLKLFLSSALVASVVLSAHAAEAGCPIDITFVNKTNKEVTIDKNESKVRVVIPATPTPSPWKKFLPSNVKLKAGKERKVAVNLALGCAVGNRKFKFFVKKGQDTFWEKKTVVTAVDKKVKVKIK